MITELILRDWAHELSVLIVMLNKRVVSVAALIVYKLGAGATFMKRNSVNRTLVEKPDTLIFFYSENMQYFLDGF